MQWSPDNVRVAGDGAVELVLDDAPAGSDRPYQGGEIQSSASAATGTWSWVAQAPEMQDGAVFGMFLYQADWKNDRWLEFDFEFVGGDTTRVELAIHMEDETGAHIVLSGGADVIELGFDAADAMHLYEIELTGTEAIFSIDGAVVATYDASDMPGNTWYSGEVKSYVDLWAVPPALEDWAGDWNHDGVPLVARLADAGTPLDPIEPQAAAPEEEPQVVAAPETEAGEDDPAAAPETGADAPEPGPEEPAQEPEPETGAQEPADAPEPEPDVVAAPETGGDAPPGAGRWRDGGGDRVREALERLSERLSERSESEGAGRAARGRDGDGDEAGGRLAATAPARHPAASEETEGAEDFLSVLSDLFGRGGHRDEAREERDADAHGPLPPMQFADMFEPDGMTF